MVGHRRCRRRRPGGRGRGTGAEGVGARLPHPARAAVLRRAGQLWEQHAEEIGGWNIREVGAIPPLAGFALHVTAAECYEASALPSAPLGSILSSEEPRLSLAQQVPVGVVGRDLAVQRAADPRHPRRRSGPRARQRRAAQARPAHGHHRRRLDGAHLRRGGTAGGAAAARARAAPRSARRWSPTRACG